jgi:hypothetical protein
MSQGAPGLTRSPLPDENEKTDDESLETSTLNRRPKFDGTEPNDRGLKLSDERVEADVDSPSEGVLHESVATDSADTAADEGTSDDGRHDGGNAAHDSADNLVGPRHGTDDDDSIALRRRTAGPTVGRHPTTDEQKRGAPIR